MYYEAKSSVGNQRVTQLESIRNMILVIYYIFCVKSLFKMIKVSFYFTIILQF